jgi:hypothetical protein
LRSGASQKDAMAISGHLTQKVFGDYNIIVGSDLKRIIQRLQEFERKEMEKLKKK